MTCLPIFFTFKCFSTCFGSLHTIQQVFHILASFFSVNTVIVKQRLPCLFLFIGEFGIFCFLDYVEELYQFYLKSSKEDLASAVYELKKMTPQPMVSMFDKQPKEAAVRSCCRAD